jgi:hypothetical protein
LFSKGDLSCPECKTVLNGALGGDEMPSDGHYSVCAYCGTISKYTGKGGALSLVAVSEEELEAVREDDPDFHQELLLIVKAVDHMKANRK